MLLTTKQKFTTFFRKSPQNAKAMKAHAVRMMALTIGSAAALQRSPVQQLALHFGALHKRRKTISQ